MSKKNNINLPILSQDAGLVRYLDEIKKFPMLSESEELELFRKWHEEQDINAAQQLVTSHLRYVAKIAMQFRGYGLPMVDLISEGNIGLMTAVKKYDPERGFRLSTYSTLWIKATIQDYILKSWSMVKIGTTATKKKLFFNLRKMKNKLLHLHNGAAPANESEIIANQLDVSEEDVKQMESRIAGDISLNTTVYGKDDSQREAIDVVEEPSVSHEIQVIESEDYSRKRTRFMEAMEELTEREQEIIYARRLSDEPETLVDLSKKYGVSSERIRQIEEKALQKLKQYVAENSNEPKQIEYKHPGS